MLRNRNEKETLKLRGVDLSTNASKLELGKFTQLANWIPGKLYSIKKKRGPIQLVSSETVQFPTETCTPGGPPPSPLLTPACGFICPLRQYSQVVYHDSTDSIGVFIRGGEGITPDHFTALAAVYDPSSHIIGLILYDDVALPTLGTQIVTVSATLVDNDVFKIEADDTNPEQYRVYVNGTPVITTTVAKEILPVTNPCTGYILPDTGGLVIDEDDEVVIIASNDQSRTSDTALTDDDELEFPIGASESWAGYVLLQFTGTSAKFTLIGPVGMTLARYHDVNWNFVSADFGTEDAGITNGMVHADFAVINGSTAGTIKVQIAQNSSNGTPTVRKAGSYILTSRQN